jgi:probable phosphoglycerate mutase
MSDLQCPATLLIACHGEARYATDGTGSDDGGGLTERGRGQVRHLVEQVRARRIADVYSSTMVQAVQSAELASSGLGVRRIATAGLQELSVGENGDAAARRFKEAINEIADARRGETVLVFTHGAVMSLALPLLSLNVRTDHAASQRLPSCVAAEVEVDADGWRIVSWPEWPAPDSGG